MRKWYVPLTILGLGGLGAMFFSKRVRQAVKGMIEQTPKAPNQLQEWNGAAQLELARIQQALDRIATQMEPGR